MYFCSTFKPVGKNLVKPEEQGFRKNRSTLDAIFITRQIVEKAIQYGKPAFMCFIDLTKAFDRVKLIDVINILML